METWEPLIGKLKEKGYTFDPGLDENELASAERKFEFLFPPDLRSFLRTAVPANSPDNKTSWRAFPDWRNHEDISKRYAALEERWRDVPGRRYWSPEWDMEFPNRESPTEIETAREYAFKKFQSAPKLIPIAYHHDWMPSEPNEPDNPILAMCSPAGLEMWPEALNLIHYLHVLCGDSSGYYGDNSNWPMDKNGRWISPKKVPFWNPDHIPDMDWI